MRCHKFVDAQKEQRTYIWELLTHSMTFEKLMDCAPPANDKKKLSTPKSFSVYEKLLITNGERMEMGKNETKAIKFGK